jgi:hypothetical protein
MADIACARALAHGSADLMVAGRLADAAARPRSTRPPARAAAAREDRSHRQPHRAGGRGPMHGSRRSGADDAAGI